MCHLWCNLGAPTWSLFGYRRTFRNRSCVHKWFPSWPVCNLFRTFKILRKATKTCFLVNPGCCSCHLRPGFCRSSPKSHHNSQLATCKLASTDMEFGVGFLLLRKLLLSCWNSPYVGTSSQNSSLPLTSASAINRKGIIKNKNK